MAKTVENYISTSLDDCKISLGYETDLSLLRKLYVRCIEGGHKSRAKLVNSRINVLKKGVKPCL